MGCGKEKKAVLNILSDVTEETNRVERGTELVCFLLFMAGQVSYRALGEPWPPHLWMSSGQD